MSRQAFVGPSCRKNQKITRSGNLIRVCFVLLQPIQKDSIESSISNIIIELVERLKRFSKQKIILPINGDHLKSVSLVRISSKDSDYTCKYVNRDNGLAYLRPFIPPPDQHAQGRHHCRITNNSSGNRCAHFSSGDSWLNQWRRGDLRSCGEVTQTTVEVAQEVTSAKV